jgi:L-aspartate oxidase
LRRYVIDLSHEDVLAHDIDVAIIGSGLAGLYAAYHLDPALRCALFTKERMETSSSSLAQGGIAAVTEKDDNFLYHFADTLNAGAGLCDEEAVRLIVEDGPNEIAVMQSLGTQFDLDSSGHLLTTREGGHGMNRILHAGGDATGLEMVRALKKTIKSKKSVSIYENAFVADVLTEEGRVAGLTVFEGGHWHLYRTRFVIIATGGLGQIYRYTTNPTVATADGFAIAQRAGAQLKDMEFIQFHPTGLYTPENRNRQCFLISEAVRGEGGILKNDADVRFMKGVHPLSELAPRDIVAREIYRQIQHQTSPFVRLDITHKPADFLTHRFPTIYQRCLEHGIDITKDYIPVGPVQHYMMGGVQTDLNGQTNVPGLLCCGETACTGVHGANRLASNSTLECLVFGRRCAATVGRLFDGAKSSAALPQPEKASEANFDAEARIIDLKGIMVKYCGILRDEEKLLFGLSRVNELLSELNNARLRTLREIELYNMAIVSRAILESAIRRRESVGAHYRTDEGSSEE